MAKITLENLAHSYKPKPQHEDDFALKELNHDWADGEAYALLGASGCGKSTLLNIISGLLHPSQGRILFNDRDVTMAPTTQRNIAQVFQFPDIQKVHWRIRKNPRRCRIDGLSVDDGCFVELGNSAFPHRGCVAPQQQCLFGFCGGVNKDRAGFFKNLWDFGAQFFAQLVIKVCQRFVQQHQSGVFDKGTRKGTTLLLAPRQFQRSRNGVSFIRSAAFLTAVSICVADCLSNRIGLAIFS